METVRKGARTTRKEDKRAKKEKLTGAAVENSNSQVGSNSS
jgi:hypothetical protein